MALSSFSPNKQISKLKQKEGNDKKKKISNDILSLPWEHLFAYFLKRDHCLGPELRTRNQACVSAAGSLICTRLVGVSA